MAGRTHLISKKPQGQITRGKTATNRLRRADNFVLGYAPELLTRRDGAFARAFFVDAGYGANPSTTLESAERFRALNPDLPVLGVEIDPERVAAALPHADAQTDFRLGGFNLPLKTGSQAETVRLIRAFNVLRQYDEDAVDAAHEQLCRSLLPGGLLIEGTSDPFGRVWVANVIRKVSESTAGRDWRVEALVFSTNFRAGFDPLMFQPVLPKNHIHRMESESMVAGFMQAWKRAALETIPQKTFGLRQWFAACAQNLAGQGYKINLRRRWLRRGYLIWRPPV